jgi:hypothetical protein
MPLVPGSSLLIEYMFCLFEAEIWKAGFERWRFLLEACGDGVVTGPWNLSHNFEISEVIIDDILNERCGTYLPPLKALPLFTSMLEGKL